MNEQALIALAQKLTASRPEVLLGIGDDTAILKPGSHPWVWSLDTLVEDVHFTRDLPAEAVGWKSLAVNLSDIAAMAAEPVAFLLSLALPPHLDTWAEAFFSGLRACAEQYQVALVGGDTVRSPRAIVISIAILGQAERPLTRSGAQAGDLLMLSGPVGASAAGLACWQHAYDAPALVAAHLRPEPHCHQRHVLQNLERCALLDVSDGLARSLQILAQDNRVGYRVDLSHVPTLPDVLPAARGLGVDPRDWILHGGEDYVLLAAVPPVSEALLAGHGWQTIGALQTDLAQSVYEQGQWHTDLRAVSAGFQHF